MVRMSILVGIAALIASPAASALAPDPKPQPAPPPPAFQPVAPVPPPPVFRPVAPPPVVVGPTSAERVAAARRAATARAAEARRAAKARAARRARLHAARAQAGRAKAARAKAARDAARKKSVAISAQTRQAIASRPHTTAAGLDPLLAVLFGLSTAFLILAASPVSAIPWQGAARVLVASRTAFMLCGAAGLVSIFVVLVV